jgi:hypothetical protein
MFPDLKPGKHLVLDNVSVADTYMLRRTVHQPRREPAESVLKTTEPWEGDAALAGSVVYDRSERTWKQWYIAFDPVLAEQRKKLGRSKHGNVGEPQPFYLCYATSTDGIVWDKPKLGIHGPNNICFKGASGVNSGSLLFRPDAPTPQQRFVLANCEWRSMNIGGIYIATSADGIHWSYPTDTDRPVIHGESDCINSLAWNAERGVYMLYLRGWHAAAVGWIKDWVAGPGIPTTGRVKNTRRRVAYSESVDLIRWSEPQVIFSPDEHDPNDFYAMGVFPYADHFLGQLWVYDDSAAETIDVELAWSRDGVTWSRHPDRPKFIPLGEKGAPDGYLVQPAHAPVVTDDAIYFYICARGGQPHDSGKTLRRCEIFRAKLRTDGFVSLDADRRLGALITRPFTLANDKITINAATQGGRIAAELVEPYAREPEGKPIDGFGKNDFDAFEGDSTAHALTWRGRSDLRALRGRRVMLRMSMYHAQLYSFTI